MAEVISVRFRETGKAYFFDPNGMKIKKDVAVIVETSRGIEYGIVTASNHEVTEEEIVSPLRKVVRIASDRDRKTAEENRVKEKNAVNICQQKILDHNLEMKCIDVEYAFDGSKILFYFTADGRVDFRELVKDLAAVFKTRIELRQVGVRDEAKLLGGLGICGLPFCCATFLDDFQPVSIKMAKEQNLSLNPTKISGTCGRLMCCLKYEQEAYEDLIRTTPKVSSVVETPQGTGTVVDVSLMTGKLKVRLDDSAEMAPKCFHKCDVCVKRGPVKGAKEPQPLAMGGEVIRDGELDSHELNDLVDAPVENKPKEVKKPNFKKSRPNKVPMKNGENKPKEAKEGAQQPNKPHQPKPQHKPQPKPKAETPAGEGENKPANNRPRRRRPYYRGKNNNANGGNKAPQQNNNKPN